MLMLTQLFPLSTAKDKARPIHGGHASEFCIHIMTCIWTIDLQSSQVEVVISTVYWTLLLSFPDLIILQRAQLSVPSSSSEIPVDFRIPLPVDLALHASPALALLADFILFEDKYTAKEARYGAPIVATLFTLWYSTWVEYFGSVNGTCKSTIWVTSSVLTIFSSLSFFD